MPRCCAPEFTHDTQKHTHKPHYPKESRNGAPRVLPHASEEGERRYSPHYLPRALAHALSTPLVGLVSLLLVGLASRRIRAARTASSWTGPGSLPLWLQAHRVADLTPLCLDYRPTPPWCHSDLVGEADAVAAEATVDERNQHPAEPVVGDAEGGRREPPT